MIRKNPRADQEMAAGESGGHLGQLILWFIWRDSAQRDSGPENPQLEGRSMDRLSTLRCHPACLLTVWGLLVGVGMILLGDYAARPGIAASSPTRWPSESSIRQDGRRPTLLIFLHPLCPCSRSSVRELASIASDYGNRVSVHAVLLQPGGGRESWGESAMEADLAAMPRLQIWRDRGGVEARRFGVSTSGHVLLYDAGGHLIFSGGITPRAATREPMTAVTPCWPGSSGRAAEAGSPRSSAARSRRHGGLPARDLDDEQTGEFRAGAAWTHR